MADQDSARRDPDRASSAADEAATTGLCVVAGEITTFGLRGHPQKFRPRDIQEHWLRHRFAGNTCGCIVSIDEQSPTLPREGTRARELAGGRPVRTRSMLGRDQGMMFGYACSETPDLLPLPIWTATARRAACRGAQVGVWRTLLPSSEATFEYENRQADRAEGGADQHPTPRGRRPWSSATRPDLIEQVIRPSSSRTAMTI